MTTSGATRLHLYWEKGKKIPGGGEGCESGKCMKLVADSSLPRAEAKDSPFYTSSYPHDLFGVYLSTGKILHFQYQPPQHFNWPKFCSFGLCYFLSRWEEHTGFWWGNLRLVKVWEIEARMAGKYQFSKMDTEENIEFNWLRNGVEWRAYLKMILRKMFIDLSTVSK